MRKLLLTFIIFTFLFCGTGAALAENWARIGSNDEVTVYYDKDSVKRKGNYYTVWTKFDYGTKGKKVLQNEFHVKYHNAAPIYKIIAETLDNYAYKIDGTSSASIYSRTYYKDGSNDDWASDYAKNEKVQYLAWQPIIPGTWGEDIYKATKPKRFGFF